MMGKIAIRTDGSHTLGLGHIVRCVALASMLKEEFDISFYLNSAEKWVEMVVVHTGFEVKNIIKEEFFFNELSGNEIVVIDGYTFDEEYQEKIKVLGCAVVYIDDFHDKRVVADLIINQAPGITKSHYNFCFPTTKFLLGLDYALLRPGFLEKARLQREIYKVQNLLIFFGGSDPLNLTLSVLQSISLFFSRLHKIRIITGRGYIHLDALNDRIAGHNMIEHFHGINEDQIISLMGDTHLAIVPSSGVLLEALALKCIVIAGYYTPNQMDFYYGCLKKGAIVGVENFSSERIQQGISNVLEIYKNPIKVNLVDGYSGERIKNAFLELFFARNLQVRLANSDDALQYFNWVNEREVRENSKNSEPIEWDEHKKWFLEKINSASSRLYYFSISNEAVGQVRFDLHENVWVISFSLEVRFRGHGLSKLIIEKAVDKLKEQFNAPVRAFVKKSNIASCKVFERLEYRRLKYEDGYHYFLP